MSNAKSPPVYISRKGQAEVEEERGAQLSVSEAEGRHATVGSQAEVSPNFLPGTVMSLSFSSHEYPSPGFILSVFVVK